MEEDEAIEMERNWADLPPELYLLILKKLPDMCDFVRSRAVCKPWCFCSFSDLPLQLPCVIRFNKWPDVELYSIAFNKVFSIHCRSSSSKRIFGVAGGCLLTEEEGSCFFFNTLNNSEVPLPVLHGCDPSPFPPFPYNFSWSSNMCFLN